jgi:hypothetical protein
MNCIYWHLIHWIRNYKRYSAISVLHTLQFTVFISRSLATDFNSLIVTAALYEVFFAQINSFLAIFFSTILPTAHSGDSQFWVYLLTWNSGTRLTILNWTLFITTLHGQNRKHRLQQYPYCCVFIDPLLRNGFFNFSMRFRFRGNQFSNSLPSNELLLIVTAVRTSVWLCLIFAG